MFDNRMLLIISGLVKTATCGVSRICTPYQILLRWSNQGRREYEIGKTSSTHEKEKYNRALVGKAGGKTT